MGIAALVGAGVKVQRGNQGMAVGQSAITITIPVAVDTAKTFVYCNFALSNDGVNEIPRYGLASGTSISLSRASTVGSVDAYWQVVEFS